MTFTKLDPQSHKGVTDVWLTPLWIIDNLGNDFDLDPCGEKHHKTANHIYTTKGLESDWFGKVWLNPPYSELSKWLDKLSEHNNGIALIFNRMDTKTLQKHVRLAQSVYFIEGRIKFLTKELKEKHNAGTGSMLLSYGFTPDYSKFRGWQAK